MKAEHLFDPLGIPNLWFTNFLEVLDLDTTFRAMRTPWPHGSAPFCAIEPRKIIRVVGSSAI
eukprot:11648200-Prorocentrum_lima.AAC.1